MKKSEYKTYILFLATFLGATWNCLPNNFSALVNPVCGDGYVGITEACDEGANNGISGCNKYCSSTLLNVTALSMGYSTACAINAGQLVCWGDDWNYCADTMCNSTVSVAISTVPLTTNATDVAITSSGGCVVENSLLSCWGNYNLSSSTALEVESDGSRICVLSLNAGVGLIQCQNSATSGIVSVTTLNPGPVAVPSTAVNLSVSTSQVCVEDSGTATILCETSPPTTSLPMSKVGYATKYDQTSASYIYDYFCIVDNSALNCWGTLLSGNIPAGTFYDVAGSFHAMCGINSSGLICWDIYYDYWDPNTGILSTVVDPGFSFAVNNPSTTKSYVNSEGSVACVNELGSLHCMQINTNPSSWMPILVMP